MHRRTLLASLAAALSGIAPVTRANDAPLQVVASFSILADWVRSLAPWAMVSSLIGSDADAHAYEPTPADVRRLAQADLIVINGLQFEGWIERMLAASGTRAAVVVATRGIEPRRVGPAADPHVWHSLAHAAHCVGEIAAALAAARAARAAEIAQRVADYRARLQALDQEAHAAFDPLPADQRCIATAHDAFGYLAADYDLRIVPVQGVGAEAEPSAARLASLVRMLRAARVRALFVEPRRSSRLVEQLARETGVAVGGTLYADALSAAGGPADTYLHLMQHNLRTLSSSLAVPEGRS